MAWGAAASAEAETNAAAYRDKFFSLSEAKTERNKAAKFYKLYGRKIISLYRPENNTSPLDPK